MDYYPFGLQTNASWTMDNSTNNFLYNEGSELNAVSGWYETMFRGYDAALGRFLQVDPLAHKDNSTSPFAYAGNNPVMFNDPSGLTMKRPDGTVDPDPTGMWNSMARSLGYDIYINWTSSYGSTSIGPGGAYGSFGGSVGADGETVWANSILFAQLTARASQGDDRALNEYVKRFGTEISSQSLGKILAVQAAINEYTTRQEALSNCPKCALADLLRNTAFFGNTPNPFYQAEAIYIDFGWALVGQEHDVGWFFVLVGKDKGSAFSYSESSMAAFGTDAGVGGEIGRVDSSGDPNEFNSEYLYGYRNKVWISGNIVGGGWSWSTFNNETVTTTSVQIGWGFMPISGGWNNGIITK